MYLQDRRYSTQLFLDLQHGISHSALFICGKGCCAYDNIRVSQLPSACHKIAAMSLCHSDLRPQDPPASERTDVRRKRCAPNAVTPAHHDDRAAGGNHVEIMNYLMEKGAPVDQTDKSGRTALHWAVISGHKEATDILLGKVGSLVPLH